MNKLEIELSLVESYDVSINGSPIGNFKKTSEWEGMIKLQNKQGVIIVSREKDAFGDLLGDLLGGPLGKVPNKAQVVKITPDLIPLDDGNEAEDK